VNSLTAVVMAAGQGTRLRPLTERWAKPVLPIDGRPVLATLLREFASAGFEEVTVVTGHLAEQVEALVEDGSPFQLRVSTVRQSQALGSADAVVRALDAGALPPLLVTAADTVFLRGDVGRVVANWAGASAAGALGVRTGGRGERTAVRVENGLVAELGGASREHTAAPLWILGEEIAEALRSVPGPPFEIAHAVQEAIAAGKAVVALDMGPMRDLTRPPDVVRHNFPYLSSEGE
jgi:UDP-N-acetylglucosamine diphosphorylase / glucose-1-phosphate thymidylyltransferase / UDP-N-acetylgalactosamine diphosphorylase / glucosamine-1-phosphate N-acetyltransferase / galactosamine-1-phosphate N-acetyltransferase